MLPPGMSLEFTVMDKADACRRNAALCQRMADESTSESDKSEWMSLVHAWLYLARTTERPPFASIIDQEEPKGVALIAANGGLAFWVQASRTMSIGVLDQG
jgi:hypothetical protein